MEIFREALQGILPFSMSQARKPVPAGPSNGAYLKPFSRVHG